MSNIDSNEEKLEIHFNPPLYIQRYLAVQNLIYSDRLRGKICKVVDFGCAELNFFKYLKNTQNIEEILEVDVDGETLIDNMHRIQPLTSDYLARRNEKLNVYVLQGSIKDPDPRLIGTDMVVGIEIIEHLYPDTLDALPYNIFGFIRPKVAVFTTPNADFNILFPSFSGLRHYDHKFEWTRKQFEDWAHNITCRFPDYSVIFDGIGELSIADSKNLGCCSQIAIFYLNSISLVEMDDNNNYVSHGICTHESRSVNLTKNGFIDRNYSRRCYYNLMLEVNYPYNKTETFSMDEQILNEIVYLLNVYGTEWGLHYNCDRQRAEIPITFLHEFIKHLCSYSELVDTIKRKYSIEKCLIKNCIEKCVIYQVPQEEDDYLESDSESNFDYNESVTDDHFSDWENTENVT